jgi:hypothetical protein
MKRGLKTSSAIEDVSPHSGHSSDFRSEPQLRHLVIQPKSEPSQCHEYKNDSCNLRLASGRDAIGRDLLRRPPFLFINSL